MPTLELQLERRTFVPLGDRSSTFHEGPESDPRAISKNSGCFVPMLLCGKERRKMLTVAKDW